MLFHAPEISESFTRLSAELSGDDGQRDRVWETGSMDTRSCETSPASVMMHPIFSHPGIIWPTLMKANGTKSNQTAFR